MRHRSANLASVAVALLLLAGTLAVALLSATAGSSHAASVAELEQRAGQARADAQSLRQEIEQRRDSVVQAEAEAAEAGARESELSQLLAGGEQRTLRLGELVAQAESRARRQRRELQQAQRSLARRLVEIYRLGSAKPLDLALADGYGELVTRAEYAQRIQAADESLVRGVQRARQRLAAERAELERRREAARENQRRLTVAHSQIASVEQAAAQRAAELSQAGDRRQESLDRLNSRIETWTDQVQRVRSREHRERASRAEAEAEVEAWLGGPYTIPTAIVMCESGGNYRALNPSSGAGGAYQIIPSTWEAYGGQGAPHEAPKAEQDRIAAQIWADSGPSAWVCKG